MFEFAPPANIDDLSAALKSEWSAIVHSWFQRADERLRDEQSPSDIRLFNLIDTPDGASGETANIPWNGFPRKYRLAFPNLIARWQVVEKTVNSDLTGRQAPYFKKLPSGDFIFADNILFRDQDEYCEWHSFRNPAGELTKVIFTCENPEYWRFIADRDPSLLLLLYQQLTDNTVQMTDLLFQEDIFIPGPNSEPVNQIGKYNPYNTWNTTHGAVHLTHPANSLSAEVFLAADASILRENANGLVTGAGELICCAAYGGPDRSSDPTIGAAVNGLVQQGLLVTINDPVGLYIHSLDPSPFEFPNGVSFDDCWKVIRGDKDANQILRAEFSLPNGGTLTDVLIGGEPLQFGSQIAEFVSVVIFGKAFDSGAGAPTPLGCVGHCCANPVLPSLQSIRPIDVPCPPLPPPTGPISARAVAPSYEPIPNLKNLKGLYSR